MNSKADRRRINIDITRIMEFHQKALRDTGPNDRNMEHVTVTVVAGTITGKKHAITE